MNPTQLDRLNAGQLIALIDRAWDERDVMREKVTQARARENNEIAVQLLVGREEQHSALSSVASEPPSAQ